MKFCKELLCYIIIANHFLVMQSNISLNTFNMITTMTWTLIHHHCPWSRIHNLLRKRRFKHRVSIEWKSPYKESYTVNSQSFDYVLGDVRACMRFQN